MKELILGLEGKLKVEMLLLIMKPSPLKKTSFMSVEDSDEQEAL